jgi:hypothetical protein
VSCVGVPLIETQNWKDDARCRGLAAETYGEINDDSWYENNPETHYWLERICARCPVIEECYAEALDTGEAWAYRAGIWFGPRSGDLSDNPETWAHRRNKVLAEGQRREQQHINQAA